MATTKIWPTKGHLASVLKYIVNEQKTDAKTYVSGLNCFPDRIGKNWKRCPRMR